MSSIWVRIDGIPATEIGPHSPPSWETLADGGCGQASIVFADYSSTRHHALRAGAVFEILCGPVSIYKGLLTEPDRTGDEIHAYGLFASLGKRLALDAGGAATRDMGVAIAQAIARGWPGRNSFGISGPVAGDSAGNPTTVGQLLTEYAEQTGQRWGTDGAGELFMTPDPSTPLWLAVPDAAAFGISDESAPAFLAGRFFNGTAFATAYAGSGEPEDAVDLSERETLSMPAAVAILNGMLTRNRGVSWVNGATLTREQLTTTGGQPAHLPGVRAGHMLRVHGGGFGARTPEPYLEIVVGKTLYDAAAPDQIYVEPVNTVPRNLSDVVADS